MKDYLILICEDDQEENCRHKYYVLINAENADRAVEKIVELHQEQELESSHGCELDGLPQVSDYMSYLNKKEKESFLKYNCEDLRG